MANSPRHGRPRYPLCAARSPSTILAIVALLLGCDVSTPSSKHEPASAFDRPQALAFAGPYLVVGNTAFRGDGEWGDGSLTVLDSATGAVVNEIPTGRNPQRIRVGVADLQVLSTGTFTIEDQVEIKTAGTFSRLPVTQLGTAASPAQTVEIPDAAPVDFAETAHGLVVASAVLPATWDLERPKRPRFFGERGDLSLGSVAGWRDHTLLLDFNTDQLHVLDHDGRVECSAHVGHRTDIEGAQSLVVEGDAAYFLLALAGTVERLDLGALDTAAPDCGLAPETVVAPAGAVPNDLHVHNGRIYVVDSGNNQVVAYRDGDAEQRWNLPVGSNPWHMAFAADGQRFAVTLWLANAVALFDLDSDAPVWMTAALTDAAAPSLGERGTAVHADLVLDAPGAGERAFGDPARATNGAQGAGHFAGSTDVYEIPPGDHLVLGWSDGPAIDGPGADLVVFENPFRHLRGVFMDPVVVEVSPDGAAWLAFPHAGPAVYVADAAAWSGLAGLTPVTYREPEGDPFHPLAGGDQFDLQDLPEGALKARILREGVSAIRLSPATDWTNPTTGAPYPADPVSDGPDIDAVYARQLGP